MKNVCKGKEFTEFENKIFQQVATKLLSFRERCVLIRHDTFLDGVNDMDQLRTRNCDGRSH